jgi:hypothetical protein
MPDDKHITQITKKIKGEKTMSKKAPANTADASSVAMFVQAKAAQGFAAPGKKDPANFLVIVTDPTTGEAITGLVKKNFTIINHFSIPGQICGFSNNIVTFNDVGTGAYQLQVAPKGCTWVAGDYLAQVIVAAKGRNGQAPVKLSIR